MPSFDVTFEVFCGKCGAGLCNQSETRRSFHRQEPQVTVMPCEICLDSAKDAGLDERQQELDSYIAELRDEIAELRDKLDAVQT